MRSGHWAISASASPFSNNFEYSVGSSTFTWQANLPKTRKYEVQAYWTPWANRTTRANYEIYHDGGVDSTIINQTTIDQVSFNNDSSSTILVNLGYAGELTIDFDASLTPSATNDPFN